MSGGGPLIELRGVGRDYRRLSLLGGSPKTNALKGVSLAIGAGERVAIIGRSGCGKSTLCRLLLGFERPDRGEVLFEGRPLRSSDAAQMRHFRRSVQIVFQDALSAINPRHRIGWIIEEPLRNLTALSPAERGLRVSELLRMVGLAPSDAAKRPAQMSGGQLQRAAIARALAPGPRLLVLDEAVSSLDIPLQLQTLQLVEGLCDRSGSGLVMVTHDLRHARRFCSRIVVFEDGELVEDQAVRPGMRFAHASGRALDAALLPAMPAPLAAEAVAP